MATSLGVLSLLAVGGVTILAYRSHYLAAGGGDWPVHRIHLRVALAAPLLVVFALVAYLEPRANLFSEAMLAEYEGYVLYMFWCLMVLQIGGAEETISYLANRDRLEWRICGCVVLHNFGRGTKSARKCYNTLAALILQYALIKPSLVLVLFASVRSCVGMGGCSKGGILSLQVFVRVTGLLCLVAALAALLQAYRWLRGGLKRNAPSGRGLLGKFMSIKLLVFLVTIQKIFISIAFHAWPADPIAEEQPPDSSEGGQNKSSAANRTYLIVLMLEAPLYATLLLVHFGAVEKAGSAPSLMGAPRDVSADDDDDGDQRGDVVNSSMELTVHETASLHTGMSPATFCCQILLLHKIMDGNGITADARPNRDDCWGIQGRQQQERRRPEATSSTAHVSIAIEMV